MELIDLEISGLQEELPSFILGQVLNPDGDHFFI